VDFEKSAHGGVVEFKLRTTQGAECEFEHAGSWASRGGAQLSSVEQQHREDAATQKDDPGPSCI